MSPGQNSGHEELPDGLFRDQAEEYQYDTGGKKVAEGSDGGHYSRRKLLLVMIPVHLGDGDTWQMLPTSLSSSRIST